MIYHTDADPSSPAMPDGFPGFGFCFADLRASSWGANSFGFVLR
jgi:hypothetical protein